MSSIENYDKHEARKSIDLAFQFSRSRIPFVVLPALHRTDFESLKVALGERIEILNKGGLTREAHERILALERVKFEQVLAELKSPINLNFYPDESVGGE